MKSCPQCNSAHAWLLGDGRYKCQSCSLRYSWKSVWDAMRLPEPAKRALLQSFVGNGDAPQSSAALDAITTTYRQRFYLLARACCALQSPVPYEALHIRECRPQLAARSTMRGWASARQVMILAIVEHAGTVRICLPPVSPVHVLGLLREHSALGGVLRVLDNLAYASLPVHGDYVTVPRVTHGVLVMHSVEAFWHHARTRLQAFRRIPLRQLPLHLAELCFRFNRRDEDPLTLVHDLLRSTAMSEVRSLLNVTHEQRRSQSVATGAHEQNEDRNSSHRDSARDGGSRIGTYV